MSERRDGTARSRRGRLTAWLKDEEWGRLLGSLSSLVTIARGLGAFVIVVAGVLAWWLLREPPQPKVESPSSQAASAQDSAPPRDDPSPCISDGDASIECSLPSAWVRVAVSPCDLDALTAKTLGVAGGSLGVELRQSGSSCVARPVDWSREAGGRVSDVLKALDGDVRDVLRECALGEDTRACTRGHDTEFVTPWYRPDPSGSHDCQKQAEAFVKRSLGNVGTGLRSVVLNSTDHVDRQRCAVRSTYQLVESVQGIGYGDLPTS